MCSPQVRTWNTWNVQREMECSKGGCVLERLSRLAGLLQASGRLEAVQGDIVLGIVEVLKMCKTIHPCLWQAPLLNGVGL